uniref:Uncharacterized protein n=1 Tax=Nonomuraea gerenzanensis TaxID=93944 RepID=A0A1M4ECD8_9ACTN|nr:hypothetical protein BN4615_P5844 [Nonomuraea gerenzanensis]
MATDGGAHQGHCGDACGKGEDGVQRGLAAHAQAHQRGLGQAEVVEDGTLGDDGIPQAGVHAGTVQQYHRAAGAPALRPQQATLIAVTSAGAGV